MAAIHLEVDRDSTAGGLYAGLGFERRARYCLMTKALTKDRSGGSPRGRAALCEGKRTGESQ
jgi:hypothetical protein